MELSALSSLIATGPHRRAASTLRLHQRSFRDHSFNNTISPTITSGSNDKSANAPYIHAKNNAADSNPSHSTISVDDQGSDVQSSDQHREPPASQSPVPSAEPEGDRSAVWGSSPAATNENTSLSGAIESFTKVTDSFGDIESQTAPIPGSTSVVVVVQPSTSSGSAAGSAARDINNSAAHHVHQQSSTAGIGTSSRSGGGSSSSSIGTNDNILASSWPQSFSATSASLAISSSVSSIPRATTEFSDTARSSASLRTKDSKVSETAVGTAATSATTTVATTSGATSTTGRKQSLKSSAPALNSGVQDSNDRTKMTKNSTQTGSASIDSQISSASASTEMSVLTASTTTHHATSRESSKSIHSTSSAGHRTPSSLPLSAIYATPTAGSSLQYHPSAVSSSHGHSGGGGGGGGGSNFTAGGNSPSGTSTALVSDPTSINDGSSSQAQQAQGRKNTIVGSVVGSVSGVVMVVAIVLVLLRYKRRKHQMRITSEDFSDHAYNDVLPPMKESTLDVTRFLPSLFSNTNRHSSNYTNSSGILGSSESRSDFNSTSNLKKFLFAGYNGKNRDVERASPSGAATDLLNSEEYTRSFFRTPRPKGKNVQVNTDSLNENANQYGALNLHSPTEEEQYHLRPREQQQEQDFSINHNSHYDTRDTLNSSTDQSNNFVTARASPLDHSYEQRYPSARLPQRMVVPTTQDYTGYNVHYAQPAPSSTGRFTETGSL